MFTTISSTTDGNPSALQVRKLTNGGYVVSRTGSQAYQQDAVFACKDIDDALGFIKDQFEPEKVVFDQAKLTDAEREEIQRRYSDEQNVKPGRIVRVPGVVPSFQDIV